MTPFSALAVSPVDGGLDDLIGLSAELVRDTVYPETEAIYILRVESRADIHFSRVNPPQAQGVNVRRGSQDHEYYFVGNDEFRVSTYRFFISAEQVGAITLEGASLTHVAINENGTRRRVRNRATPVTLDSRPKPESYQGYWLPSEQVTLEQHWSTKASALQVGDSITRTLTLYIQGRNIDSFPELVVDYPEGMNVYSEQPKFDATDGGMTMTLRQVIVPRSEGLFEIPSLAIPWFDTSSNTIAVASLKGLALNILPNELQTLALHDLQPEELNGTYWRYATIAVVLLWLITLLHLYQLRKRLKEQERAAIEGKKQGECKLQAALEQGHHQAIVGAWGNAEPSVKKECGQLMDAYFAAFYSRTVSDGEPERTAVLKHLKARRAVKEKTADFAPIAP
ncbi:hypothetical protein RJ45_16820 [Photobacterium gaetbulicola]|uniref:BatD n=2 Tax=Photobacterium gaetbulicola TaxID=1295392 RepID=A0A0B9GC65_9GAMM|nr:hypothetical protein RJ45_16820 [Photobacterium gaetbulicola]